MSRIADLVKVELDLRADVGTTIYGKPLTDGNDLVVRDWLCEAYLKALDMAIYLRKELAERKRLTN